MVLFGQETCLPIELISGIDVSEEFGNPSEYVLQVARCLSSVSQTVKRHQGRVTQRQKEYYDLKITDRCLSLESWCGCENRLEGRGSVKFIRLFTVIRKLYGVLYKLSSELGGQSFVVHYNHLKPSVNSRHKDTDHTQEHWVRYSWGSPITALAIPTCNPKECS